MSNFSNTYLHSVLIGLDQFGAALFFNRNDITISSICGLVLNNDYDSLKLHRWQVVGCRYLGKLLNLISTNHCNEAILGDFDRAFDTIKLTEKL
jgi:hypothetical protein